MKYKSRYLCFLLGGLAAIMSIQAQAVPSFARQTGMACSACHMIFLELTPFGRSFKLNGYTLSNIKQVEAKNSTEASGLQIDQIAPLSAMLQITGTNAKSQSPSSQISLPDQFSLFYAGAISPHMGSFIQATMGQGSGFEMDNVDIRYANHAGNVTYGVTLNNNPTVQDLWNSTPAWGYPWTGGAGVTAPVVADGLGQNVVGLGGYADWGNGFFTELSVYRDTNTFDAPSGAEVSAGVPQQVRVRGLAPYWRLAWDKTLDNGDDLMVGAYGLQATLYATDPDAFYAGPADKYNDVAIDSQYIHPLANSSHTISAHASYTSEKQTLDLTDPGNSPTLKSLRLDGTFHWGYHVAASLAYAVNSGSNVGDAYNDKAWTLQASYLPWQNTKFTVQYVKYTELAGMTDSNATDNNTLMLQGWLMW